MHKYTILIVEDERPLRTALKEELEDSGFAVLEAGDGEEGLTVANAEHPQLILLDIILPIKDGISMLRDLRKSEWGKKVHVILLTNVSGPEKMTEAAELGAYDYFVKTDNDLARISQHIRERLEAKHTT